MSTVEGYELHVYCDKCNACDKYAGSTRGRCYRDARDAGWKISNRAAPRGSKCGGRAALCSAHSGKPVVRRPLKPGQRYVTLNELRGRDA